MTDILDEEPAVPKTVDSPLPELPEEDDDDLDSFFKKKTKKGKKKKKKRDKDGAGENDTDKPKKSDDSQTTKKSSKDDKSEDKNDEWNDFEDESLRDYSDLKIQNLQITEEPLPVNEPEPEYDEDGELIPSKAEQGPWNKSGKVATEDSSERVETPVAEEPKKTGAYRPPGSRGLGGAYRPPGARDNESGGRLTPLRRMKAAQKAPDMGDQMAFPSLNAAAEDTQSHKGFEVVKNTGAKSVQAWRSKRVAAASSEVRLGNQFSALSSNR